MTDDTDPLMQAAQEADAAASGEQAPEQPEPVPHATKPLGSYAGNDISSTLNDLAARLTGTSTLPRDIRFGESGAASLEHFTGHSAVPPHLWFIGASLVLVIAYLVRRQEQQAPSGAPA